MLIPDEDDLTKQQLWKRCDDVAGVAANIKDELYPLIKNITSATIAAVREIMSEQKDDFQKTINELNTRMLKLEDNFKKITQDALAAMGNKLTEQMKTLDARSQNQMSQVDEKITQRLDPVINRFNEQIISFQESIRKTFGTVVDETKKYQVTVTEKVSSLSNEVKDVMGKFKVIGNNLK